MNPRIESLHAYPFTRLAALKRGTRPPADRTHIGMSIGEPQHEPPAYVAKALADAPGLGAYPPSAGLPEMLAKCAAWLERRFGLPRGAVDPATSIVPVNGTREGLFSFVQAVVGAKRNPAVLLPNPFYQIYEGAALLAGAEPVYLNTTEDTGLVPDLDALPAALLSRTEVLILCSPGNPTGAVMSEDYLAHALDLAQRFDFVIAADECYADIYLDETVPPPGLLAVAHNQGNENFERCVVFHSLSKRSNVPGLRSGFIAGDAKIMSPFKLYRTYHGCAMPIVTQHASIPAWQDEATPAANRELYRQKYRVFVELLAPHWRLEIPPASFYLWATTPIDDERFVKELFDRQNVTLLPGRYLARDTDSGNPGANRVRISLVPTLEQCRDAAGRITEYLESL